MSRVLPALLAVIGAYLGLELALFDESFIFHGDHERDLRYVTLWVRHGIWPEASPSISPLPFELGPLCYVLFAPAVAISPDPFVVRVWILLLAAAGVFVLYRLLASRLRAEAAVFAVFGLLSSAFTYELSRQLWHSSLLLLPTAGFLWAVTRLLEDDDRATRYGIYAAVLAAVCLQLHMAASVFAVVLVGAAILRRRSLGPRGVALGVLAFVVAWLPMGIGVARALSSGALHTMGGHGDSWAPVNPLPFFVDNVHTIWGDDLGPLLTLPWIAIIALGAAQAARRRGALPRLLLAVVIVGFFVEAALLGNQPRAYRYMHANLVAAFGLAAVGLDQLLGYRPGLRWGFAAIAVVVTVEAAVSEVPHAADQGWLNAREQRAVAELVAAELPLSEEEAEVRIHGIFFGGGMGMGHLWTLYAGDGPAFSDTAHVIVMPDDLALHGSGTAVGQTWTIKGDRRNVAVYAREPVIDYARLQVPDSLRHRWRRRRRFEGTTAWLRVPVLDAAVVHVAWLEARGGRDPCTPRVSLDKKPVASQEVAAPNYAPLRLLTLSLPHAGDLEVTLEGCRGVTLIDLW